MSSYDTSSDTDPCIYTFCKASTDICKLRIDFESMTVDTSSGYIAYPLVAARGDAFNNGLSLGKCDTDFVTITNPGGTSPPKICGVNTGQHMFIDASSSCNDIKVDIDTGVSTTRSWQIKVTQYTCASQMIPVENCLQYHTGTSGTFYSFGWDTSVTTITSTTHNHLQDQHYEVCFRRERGYCSLCLTAQIWGTAAIIMTSYGVSAAGSAIGHQATDSLCGLGLAAIAQTNNHLDYIEVVNLQPSIGTTATAGAHKMCGFVWNSIAIGALHAIAGAIFTSCTWSTPFKFGVRFNAEEINLDVATAAAIAAIVSENVEMTTGAGTGMTGFYMAYWQNTC